MDTLRKLHNDTKREIIKDVVQIHGARVLDVGSGRGGDLSKWKMVRAKLTMIDPDRDSVTEAKERAKNVYPEANIMVGDISEAPAGPFEYICFNFSLQYCFKDEDYLKKCIKEISDRLVPGGMFFGVAPDAEKILKLPEYWKDELGNTIQKGPSIGKHGHRIGEMILVRLADGPYYASGHVPEPMCYFTKLIEICFDNRLALLELKPFVREPKNTITDVYSKFIFRRLR